jgi:hypothetical protein
MKQIEIAPGFSLPLNIVTMRTAIYGTSGAGKTTFTRLLAERVHEAKQRFCAIDLKNDWWGLKSRADGKAAGIPVVIFGGPRRDIQIFPDGGAATAETVVSIEQSCIIDLDDFTKKKQLVFLTAFLDRLYELNRKPLLLFGDESDRYASQKPMSAEMHESLGASEDIARRGRKRGIGSAWLTQRYASLNKNVSDLCDLTVVFRTPGSRDLDELKERVGRVATREQVAEVMRLAPGLEDGQAIFLSSHPKLRKLMPAGAQPLQLPLPWTFDSSATPGVGQRRREPKVLAKSDLAQIEERMAAQVERAKLDDPKALRAELAKVKAELKKAQGEAAASNTAYAAVQSTLSELKGKKVDAPILKAKDATKIETAAKRFQEAGTRALNVGDGLIALLRMGIPDGEKLVFESGLAVVRQPFQLKAQIERSHSALHQTLAAPPPAPKPAPTPAPATAAPTGELTISGPMQKILNTLESFETLGVQVSDRSQIALFSGASPTSSSYANNLSALSSAGLIVYPTRGKLQLTDAGRAVAVDETVFSSLEQLHDTWIGKVGGACGKILRALIDAYPNPVPKELLAENVQASPTSSSYANNLSTLRTLGVIDYPRKGLVIATPLLFPPI